MNNERKGDQMKKAIAAFMAFTMCISLASCSQSSKYSLSNVKLTETDRSWKNPEAKYAELVKQYGEETCPGTFVVATDKDIIYLYAEKELEKDGKTLESQDTVFDMASVSKTFTAVAVLQLKEKNKLGLDDTLDKYFPEYEAGKKITINNLLHMTSGIADYCNNPDPFWNISGADAANQKLSDIFLDKITDEEFLQALYKAPLDFEPGTKFEYSNTNYHLLAFIIEKVSGMKYCDYVKKNIFDKCGMTKTTSMATGDMTYKPEGFDELVQYGFTDKDGYPAGPNNYRGDSGIHSCLTDMVKFDRALFAGKLLNKASMEIMLKDENGYCCGLMKEKDGYSHNGSSFTCNTDNKIIESEEFGHIYIIKLERELPIPEIEDPMIGTNFKQSIIKGDSYTNEYAGLKLKLPKGLPEAGEHARKTAKNADLQSTSDKKVKSRDLATRFDAAFWSTEDCVEVHYMNRKLGVTYDQDYTEEDWLNDLLKEFTEHYEKHGGKVASNEITKVTLGGKEYLRLAMVLELDGQKGNCYLYARKLDDNLIVRIDGVSWSGKTNEYFEKMFE